MKSEVKFIHFHPRKCIWKCLENGGHFVLAQWVWLYSTPDLPDSLFFHPGRQAVSPLGCWWAHSMLTVAWSCSLPSPLDDETTGPPWGRKTCEIIMNFNSLAPGKFEWNFRYLILQVISVIDGWGICCELALDECHSVLLVISQHWLR